MRALHKRVADLEGQGGDGWRWPVVCRIGDESEADALARDGRGIAEGEPVTWLRWRIVTEPRRAEA